MPDSCFTLRLNVTPEMYAKVEEWAKSQNCSRAEMVRDMIQVFLDSPAPEETVQIPDKPSPVIPSRAFTVRVRR